LKNALPFFLSQPEIGPRRDRLAEGLRVHFHRDYALYYRFADTEVVIVRVVHSARDVQDLTLDHEQAPPRVCDSGIGVTLLAGSGS
jgi:hypothetical protein